MEELTQKDREIVRDLAKKKMELAHSPRNLAILEKWHKLGAGIKDSPTMRFPFSNFPNEVLGPLMKCESKLGRDLEYSLLYSMCGQEVFGDDTPISDYFPVGWHKWIKTLTIDPQITRAEGENAKGFHIDPVIEDIEEEKDKFQRGSFGVDRERTMRRIETVGSVIGDILPVKLTMDNLGACHTGTIVMLTGMEAYYTAMYDCPEVIHEIMETITKIYEDFYDFVEKENLLLPTIDMCGVNQESYAFNHELPTDMATKTTDVWGFMESQETTAVSPETFGEFVFPYQDRLAKRFGLVSYGCCERVDAIFPDYLSKWKNLRKLSVSPFNNEAQVGEYLRGSNIVYYSKPRAEFVTNAGPLDEEGITQCFKSICECSSGCLFEVAQREVGTIYHDMDRARTYVRLAKEAIEKYWKP